MAKFFINRPIVAIVIAILMVLIGLVSMLSLPTAPVSQYRRPDDPGESHLPWCGRPNDCRVQWRLQLSNRCPASAA